MNTSSRRDFVVNLAKAGIILPVLESVPSLYANPPSKQKIPMNFLFVGLGLGWDPQHYMPSGRGLTYTPSLVMRPIYKTRIPHTIITDSSHHFNYGHPAGNICWTAWPYVQDGVNIGHRISLDQKIADFYRGSTLLPYFNLAGASGGGLSYNARGARIGGPRNLRVAYDNLFKPRNPNFAKKEYENTKSLVSFMSEKLKTFRKDLSSRDNYRLEDYLSSLNILEKTKEERYKADLHYKPPAKIELQPATHFEKKYKKSKFFGGRAESLELMRLVLLGGFTRVVSYDLGGGFVDFPRIGEDWHTFTHHGNRKDRLKYLKIMNKQLGELLADFLVSLRETPGQASDSLLDETIVLMSCGLGDAAAHRSDNVPLVVLGGNLKHKGHISYKREARIGKRPYTANFFLEILHHIGVEAESFGNSTKVSNIWS